MGIYCCTKGTVFPTRECFSVEESIDGPQMTEQTVCCDCCVACLGYFGATNMRKRKVNTITLKVPCLVPGVLNA